MSILGDPAFLAPSVIFFVVGSILLFLIAWLLSSDVLPDKSKNAATVLSVLLFLLLSIFWYYMSTARITENDTAKMGLLIEYVLTKLIALGFVVYFILRPNMLSDKQYFLYAAVALRVGAFLIEFAVSYIYRKKTTSSVDLSQKKIYAFFGLVLFAILFGSVAVLNDNDWSGLCKVLSFVLSFIAAIIVFTADLKGGYWVGIITLFAAGIEALELGAYNKWDPNNSWKGVFTKISLLFLVYGLLQLSATGRQDEGAPVGTTPPFYSPIVPQKPASSTETKTEATAPTLPPGSGTEAPAGTFPSVASVDIQTIISLISASSQKAADNQVTNTSVPAKTANITTPVSIVNNDDFNFLKDAYADRPASLAKSDYLPVNSAVVSTPCIVALLGETLDWFKKHTLNSCLDGYPFCLAPNEDGTCIVPTISVNINNQNKAYLNGMVAGFFKTLFPDIPVVASPYQSSADNSKWTAGYNTVVKNTSLASQQIYKPIGVRQSTPGLVAPAVVSASASQNLFVSNESRLISSLSFKIDKTRLSEGSGDPKKSFHVKLTDATASSITIFQFTKCSYFIPDATISKGGIRGTFVSDRLQVDMYLVKLPSDSYKIVSIQELAADGSVTNVITKRYKSNLAWVGSTCSISLGDKFADNSKCPSASKTPELYEASVSSVAYTYSTASNQVRLGGSLSSIFYPVVLSGGIITDDRSGVTLSLDGTSSPSQVLFGDNYKVNNSFSSGGRLPGRSIEFTVSTKAALSYAFLHPTPDASIVIDNLGATLVVKGKRIGSANSTITLSSLTGSAIKARLDVSESAISLSVGGKKAVFSTNTPKTTGSTLYLGASGAGTITVSNITVI